MGSTDGTPVKVRGVRWGKNAENEGDVCSVGGFTRRVRESGEEHMEIVDRQLQVYDDWDAKLRERLRAQLTDELIEEHERKPLGQHSDALERILAYFRRQPPPGKYVILATKPWEEYRIAVLSGERGRPAEIVDDESFPTEEAAMHGVFLRRVRDLGES
jgi:branched-chain amino acid transport system permease protein